MIECWTFHLAWTNWSVFIPSGNKAWELSDETPLDLELGDFGTYMLCCSWLCGFQGKLPSKRYLKGSIKAIYIVKISSSDVASRSGRQNWTGAAQHSIAEMSEDSQCQPSSELYMSPWALWSLRVSKSYAIEKTGPPTRSSDRSFPILTDTRTPGPVSA